MEPVSKPVAITKVLSPNDAGETSGHQTGILIPKDPLVLAFFPDLDESELNPRVLMYVLDDNNLGLPWRFTFVHYNNKRISGGTRDEYRLTPMRRYLQTHRLQAGDEVLLYALDSIYHITFVTRDQRDRHPILKLGDYWKAIYAT